MNEVLNRLFAEDVLVKASDVAKYFRISRLTFRRRMQAEGYPVVASGHGPIWLTREQVEGLFPPQD